MLVRAASQGCVVRMFVNVHVFRESVHVHLFIVRVCGNVRGLIWSWWLVKAGVTSMDMTVTKIF